LVPIEGLAPPRFAAPDSKSGVSSIPPYRHETYIAILQGASAGSQTLYDWVETSNVITNTSDA